MYNLINILTNTTFYQAKNLSTDKDRGSSRRSLNEKLAKVLLDSPVEVESGENLDQEVSSEAINPTDATLQEPLHPLTCVQEEQVPRVSISKISKEHEKVQKELEEKLREANKRIDELTDKNASLTNALFFKEESVAEILRCKQEADAEFKTLRLKHTRLTKH